MKITQPNKWRNKTSELKVGDFIQIHAWDVDGCVILKKESWIGDESSVEIELQTEPDGPTKTYRIEDEQFSIK